MNLERMAAIVANLQLSQEWMVIDPQGRVYRGPVAEMTQVLLQHHPLLNPVAIGACASTLGEAP
jgi:hypothetical protein